MAPKNLRPIEEKDGECKCYLCGAPASQVKTMKTPSGGSYLRGWCDPCLDGSTPKARKNAAYQDAAETASKGRHFTVGTRVEFMVRATVLTYHPKGNTLELLVGREVVILSEKKLKLLIGSYEEEEEERRAELADLRKSKEA